LAALRHGGEHPAARGIPGVPGSRHPKFTGVLHREHAIVEDQARRTSPWGCRTVLSSLSRFVRVYAVPDKEICGVEV